jgi:hypothetical protein
MELLLEIRSSTHQLTLCEEKYSIISRLLYDQKNIKEQGPAILQSNILCFQALSLEKMREGNCQFPSKNPREWFTAGRTETSIVKVTLVSVRIAPLWLVPFP